MSCTLITGLPGNGKTLYAIWTVQQRAQAEHRPVFYSGIKDLQLDWEKIDPYEWHKAPVNAIVVIDEAQRSHDEPDSKKARGKLFGVRPRGEEPDWVTQLEVHRHGGIDLVLLTQHPMFVSSHVRKLCDRHLHLIRRWGLSSSTVHEWGEVREDCHRRRADSSKATFKFPRQAYGWYKSAEAHTMRVRIPWRVWAMGGVLLALAGLVWFVWSRLAAQLAPKLPVSQSVQHASPGPMRVGAPGGDGGQGLRPPGQALTRYEWVAQWEPRVQGLGYTAPAYDDLTKPVEVPYPAACVVMKKECRCYTQQATRLDVPDALCRAVVDRGFFVAWRGQGQRDQARPVAVGASAPSPATAVPGAGLIVIGGEPRGPAVSQRVSVLDR